MGSEPVNYARVACQDSARTLLRSSRSVVVLRLGYSTAGCRSIERKATAVRRRAQLLQLLGLILLPAMLCLFSLYFMIPARDGSYYVPLFFGTGERP